MPYNKMKLTWIDLRKIKNNIVLVLAGFIVLALAANSIVHAAGKVTADGTLTAIDDDGSVIIDDKGYLLSSSATIRNYEGDRVSLRDFLPSRYVHFEYEQTREGFMIIFIQEVPQ